MLSTTIYLVIAQLNLFRFLSTTTTNTISTWSFSFFLDPSLASQPQNLLVIVLQMRFHKFHQDGVPSQLKWSAASLHHMRIQQEQICAADNPYILNYTEWGLCKWWHLAARWSCDEILSRMWGVTVSFYCPILCLWSRLTFKQLGIVAIVLDSRFHPTCYLAVLICYYTLYYHSLTICWTSTTHCFWFWVLSAEITIEVTVEVTVRFSFYDSIYSWCDSTYAVGQTPWKHFTSPHIQWYHHGLYSFPLGTLIELKKIHIYLLKTRDVSKVKFVVLSHGLGYIHSYSNF